MLGGRTLPDVLGLQGAMYEYHSKLTATHAFSSPWWTWPLMLRPLWLYVSTLPNNFTSTIVLMGNPAVWWVGFASLILVTAKVVLDGFGKKLTKKPLEGSSIRRANLAAVFIVVIFFFQWLPYVLISRVTFIYHFYVNVPFLCLATAYFISKYWSSKWVKVAALAYFVGVVALFALFYSAISGTPASTSSIEGLKWLSGWSF
jgi:dolichyl-phosphate-mannose--protein O-mannosyl transferase